MLRTCQIWITIRELPKALVLVASSDMEATSIYEGKELFRPMQLLLCN